MQRLKLWLAPLVWRLLAATVRCRPRGGTGRRGPIIFACLHRDMLPALLHVRPARPALLVSRSSDGEILLRTLAPEGFAFVRGSTGKAGSEVVRGLLRALRAGGAVGLAVDGPRGPFGAVHEGVLQLARLSGAPVLPLRARPGRHVALSTWDRTVVPLPFGACEMSEGPDIHVPRDATTEQREAAATALAGFLLDGTATR